MAVRPEPFAASGQVVAPADATPETEIAGLAVKGFTSVTVYDGADNTGTVVLHQEGPGTISLDAGVVCQHGVFVEAAGTGSGSVWM